MPHPTQSTVRLNNLFETAAKTASISISTTSDNVPFPSKALIMEQLTVYSEHWTNATGGSSSRDETDSDLSDTLSPSSSPETNCTTLLDEDEQYDKDVFSLYTTNEGRARDKQIALCPGAKSELIWSPSATPSEAWLESSKPVRSERFRKPEKLPSSQLGRCPYRPLPSWHKYFVAGTKPLTEDHPFIAKKLIFSVSTWNSQSLSELAQHFCWMGASGTAKDTSAVAPFAKMIHLGFYALERYDLAGIFVDELHRTTKENVYQMWNPAEENIHSITPRRAPSASYIDSALSFSSFIGDLYTQTLLPASFVDYAIRAITDDDEAGPVYSVERLKAIDLLVKSSGLKYWKDPEMFNDSKESIWAFARYFLSYAKNVRTDSYGSALGRQKKTDRSVLVRSVKMTLVGFLRELRSADVVCDFERMEKERFPVKPPQDSPEEVSSPFEITHVSRCEKAIPVAEPVKRAKPVTPPRTGRWHDSNGRTWVAV